MKFFRRDERGAVASAAVVTLLSAVVGGGAAAAAIVTVVNTQGPKDSSAIQNGEQNVLDPAEIINYGG
jgi:hypothetical protein